MDAVYVANEVVIEEVVVGVTGKLPDAQLSDCSERALEKGYPLLANCANFVFVLAHLLDINSLGVLIVHDVCRPLSGGRGYGLGWRGN